MRQAVRSICRSWSPAYSRLQTDDGQIRSRDRHKPLPGLIVQFADKPSCVVTRSQFSLLAKTREPQDCVYENGVS